jgi:peptidoglycan biosynthesis protein MviN/MurJ (putative lipid II flippase)
LGTVWIDLAFASTLGTGGLSVLEYGNRLMTVLPVLMSTSLMTVMYTEYSHGAVDGTAGSMQRSLVRTARGGLFLLVPLIGFMALWADGIVGLVLHHGAFRAETADLTTGVMRMIAPAVVFSFLTNILTSGLFADTEAPRIKILVISVSVALICRIVSLSMLIGPFGVSGIALSNSIAAMCLLGVLYPMLRRHWGCFVTRSDVRSVVKIVAAAAVSLVLAHLVRAWPGFPRNPSEATEALLMLGSAGVGGCAYLALATVLRLRELSTLGGFLKRKRS